jgi:hypothetical protein
MTAPAITHYAALDETRTRVLCARCRYQLGSVHRCGMAPPGKRVRIFALAPTFVRVGGVWRLTRHAEKTRKRTGTAALRRPLVPRKEDGSAREGVVIGRLIQIPAWVRCPCGLEQVVEARRLRVREHRPRPGGRAPINIALIIEHDRGCTHLADDQERKRGVFPNIEPQAD